MNVLKSLKINVTKTINMKLEDRMKEFYENRTRIYLPRRSDIIIRLDGRGFSKFTKRFKKPFDEDFINMMNETAKYVCENISGCKIAYVQSDEISLLITDYDTPETDCFFNNNLQKLCSISASLATAKFNQLWINSQEDKVNIKLAQFDSRVFTIPYKPDLVNYFIWRQTDCIRNSKQMAAQSYFSHKQLNGLDTDKQIELLKTEKGVDWNQYPLGQQQGRIIIKVREVINNPYVETNPNPFNEVPKMFLSLPVVRNKWHIKDAYVFKENKAHFYTLIPSNEDYSPCKSPNNG
jgi:tRNA(His) guanylyltransferase